MTICSGLFVEIKATYRYQNSQPFLTLYFEISIIIQASRDTSPFDETENTNQASHNVHHPFFADV